MIFSMNYKNRIDEIEEIFRLTTFITNVQTHKNRPVVYVSNNTLFITQEMQCAIKAQFLIVLYNIVEWTIYNCLYCFYDSIFDEELTFADLSDEIRNMWKSYLKRNSNPDYMKSDAELMSRIVRFDGLPVSLSGNLDMRKIHDIFLKHGCYLDETNRYKYSSSFLTVKNRRNSLSHGNISFAECGSNYLISDLKKLKDDIISGLNEIIEQVDDYVNHRRYLRY